MQLAASFVKRALARLITTVFNRLIHCPQLPDVPSSACLGHCLHPYQALDSSTLPHDPTVRGSNAREELIAVERRLENLRADMAKSEEWKNIPSNTR